MFLAPFEAYWGRLDSLCPPKSIKIERVKNGPMIRFSASARELAEVPNHMCLVRCVAVLVFSDPRTSQRCSAGQPCIEMCPTTRDTAKGPGGRLQSAPPHHPHRTTAAPKCPMPYLRQLGPGAECRRGFVLGLYRSTLPTRVQVGRLETLDNCGRRGGCSRGAPHCCSPHPSLTPSPDTSALA